VTFSSIAVRRWDVTIVGSVLSRRAGVAEPRVLTDASLQRIERCTTTVVGVGLIALMSLLMCGRGIAGGATTAIVDQVTSRTAPPGRNRDLERAMTDILEAHHAKHEFVGAVLALRNADGTKATVTSGTKKLNSDAAVDPDVPWGIGSVTKTFVAVVMLQLVEEGRIDLDAGIDKYMPDLPGADRITPRQLLQHTSGLGEYLDDSAVQNDGRRRWAPSELIAVAEAAGRTGEPGSPYSYSNTNYIVLGEIIKQVTGNSWLDEVRTRILEPLHLRHTRLGVLKGAPGYGVEGDMFVDYTDRWHPSIGGASGGLQSTARDLLVFARALATGRLLSDRSEAEMTTFIPAEDYSAYGVVHEYGLGLERYANEDVTVFGNLGSGAAHSSFIGFDPTSGAAVAVTLNSDTPGPQAVMALEALAAVRK
jgi:D-alanyl-D-alanine carboxypeptidase